MPLRAVGRERREACGGSSGRGEQVGQQRHEGNANQRDASARDKLFDALAFCPWIIIAVAFEEVDSSPEAQPRAEGHHEGLEYAYRCLKKCHVIE